MVIAREFSVLSGEVLDYLQAIPGLFVLLCHILSNALCVFQAWNHVYSLWHPVKHLISSTRLLLRRGMCTVEPHYSDHQDWRVFVIKFYGIISNRMHFIMAFMAVS